MYCHVIEILLFNDSSVLVSRLLRLLTGVIKIDRPLNARSNRHYS
jgi:hypothetical protein